MLIEFILNDKDVIENAPLDTPLVDIIRGRRLVGTKIGCREGDCGACTILVGKVEEGHIKYRSMVSCLMPLRNAHGCHIVTIESLMHEKNPVLLALSEKNATQCGFCTPGFAVAIIGGILKSINPDQKRKKLIEYLDGNICRCTGYKSIERAVEMLDDNFFAKDKVNSIESLIDATIIPAYFENIADRVKCIKPLLQSEITADKRLIANGTDHMVQNPKGVAEEIHFIADLALEKSIIELDTSIEVGAAATCTDFMESKIIQKYFPRLPEQLQLVSSTPIRNMGTLAGNFVNASPIGDLTNIFIALNAEIELKYEDQIRRKFLKDLYLGYKKLDLKKSEIITKIVITKPLTQTHFNFQKVSKRKILDIATVTSAMKIEMTGDVIKDLHISMGGVGPFPLYLTKTRQSLIGKTIDSQMVKDIDVTLQQELAPISDIRGSESYKRLLARQIIYSHFIDLFPQLVQMENLV